jgi:hypothetical protein
LPYQHEETRLFVMAVLARKANAIRQDCCFAYSRHEKAAGKAYSCQDFSYDLNTPSCRVFLHLCQEMRECRIREAPLLVFFSYLDFTRPIDPRYAGDKCLRAFAKNERGDSLSMQHDVGDDFEGDDSKGC